MPEPTLEAWAQIRHAYEHTDKPIAHICAEHEITVPMMRYRMKRWQWTRRKPLIPRHGPPPAPVIIEQAAAFAQPTPTPTLPLSGAWSSGPASHPTPPAFADASAGDPPHRHSASETRVNALMAGDGMEQAAPTDLAPAAIVPRLQSAVARVLPAIEATIARLADGSHDPRAMEQAGRALSALTRTLRELNGLLAQHNARLSAADPYDDDMPEDIDAFRHALARRIEALFEEEAEPDSAPG